MIVRGEKKGKTYEVLLDADDFDWASDKYWYIQPHGRTHYVWRNEWSGAPSQRRKRKQALHRLILERVHGSLGDQCVDHINGNGLDNHKSNLRLTDRSGNMRNSRRRSTKKSSIYKGVYRKGPSYMVRISQNGKTVSLGNYASEREAAIVYNIAAKRLFGDFAHLNEVDTSTLEEERLALLMEARKPRKGERHDCRRILL